ncbi:MAG: ANTAR domain-containing protein [Peptococcaceae bacterium]|nr:ANTAR domain-containing protein [Peptococcaceae bacterium]
MKAQRIVIVATESQVRAEAKQVLNVYGSQVTGEAANPEDGLRLIRRVQPDLVLLDPSGKGLALLDILGQEAEIPVVAILAPQEQHLLERVVQAGAAGVVFQPVGALDCVAALTVATHNFQRLAGLQRKLRQIEEEAAIRKLVDRAKSKVMENAGMSESEAYRWLQKTSMDTQKSLKRIATDVLKDRIEI